jgi:hypothetical protein
MLTSLRRRMGNSCSDTCIVEGGLKPPIVDSPWVICLVVMTMIVLGLLCLFHRAPPSQPPQDSATLQNPMEEASGPAR